MCETNIKIKEKEGLHFGIKFNNNMMTNISNMIIKHDMGVIKNNG